MSECNYSYLRMLNGYCRSKLQYACMQIIKIVLLKLSISNILCILMAFFFIVAKKILQQKVCFNCLSNNSICQVIYTYKEAVIIFLNNKPAKI